MSAVGLGNAHAAQAGATVGEIEKPAVNSDVASQPSAPSQQDQFEQLQKKYAAEREKRLRAEGGGQYVRLINSDKYKHLAGDRWVDQDKTPRLPLRNGMHTKVFIIGAGFGGLCYAVRLVQAGIKPEDIILADVAGGFGGTWYWNRYPGLMCDVESYIYMPFLEETGYVPKHKYSYGSEIREHANRIAKKWHLENRGAFQQEVTKLNWNDNLSDWQITTTDLATNKSVSLSADFVVIAPGLLHQPKLTEFEGIDTYRGHIFHTARWDYEYTGGSPQDPSLTGLQGKRVGLIGTGATAIQAVPHLARYAKELYIFQRTPSAVDRRDQHATDPKEFAKQIGNKPGWQWERNKNFNSFLNDVQPKPDIDLVKDGWSRMPSYSALLGGPKKVTYDNIANHVASLHAKDAPRQEYIRNRVDEIVKDQKTAQALKPWYPGWCKRPTFHDEYLQTFNEPHVHLIDTDGAGINHLSSSGIVANSNTYELDCIIFGTGYSLDGSKSPTARAGITTHGRHGSSLDKKWAENVATLHGLLTHDFPNLFFSGPTQATASANFAAALDLLAKQTAYIVSQATKRCGTDKVTIEPTEEAEEEWTTRIMSGAMVYAALAGCTPSYLNGEGMADKMTSEQKMKSARAAMWSAGFNDFARVLQEWTEEGEMKGLEVRPVQMPN